MTVYARPVDELKSFRYDVDKYGSSIPLSVYHYAKVNRSEVLCQILSEPAMIR